jgi:Domain of unknown function (DUF4261)
MSLFNWKKKPAEPKPLHNAGEMLFARLLFETTPVLDDALLAGEISKRFSRFEAAQTKFAHARQYFFHDYMSEFKEGSIPAQCTIFQPDGQDDIHKKLEKAYQQLWHWPEAKEETASCKYELVVSDLMSRPLPYKKRNELFQNFVIAVAKSMSPKAIYFPTSEKLVETQEYLAQVESQGLEYLYGLLNVRLFNLPDESLLMDTVGLHAFELPDFQFRFKDHDASVVAGLLSSYGHYIFGYGSVILDGETVEGVEDGSKWKCVYSQSLLPPERNVLNIQE